MRKRQRNFIVNGSHWLLVLMLAVSVFGFFPGGIALGCLTVSTGSMLLLLTQMRRLLRTYYNRYSRVKYRWPVAAGLIGCTLAIVFSSSTAVALAAGVELALWAVLCSVYLRNKRNFVMLGDGPMPKNTWVNPPLEALGPGHIIIMSGRMSRRMRVSVGHMEVLLSKRKGNAEPMLHSFTAYIEKGVIWHTARATLKMQLRDGHYIALKPRTPWTQEQNDRAVDIAGSIFEQNRQWLARELPRRTANFERWFSDARCNKPLLRWFMPRLREVFRKFYLPTGYDHVSMHVGTRRKEQWTCQSAVTDVVRAVGVQLDDYESGMLGLGTGALDLPNPIEIVDDPCYELLTLEHKAAFEASRPAVSPETSE